MSDQYTSSPRPSITTGGGGDSRRYVRGHGYAFHTIDGELGPIAYAARCACGDYRCSSDELELAEQCATHLEAHAFGNGVR